MAPDDGLWRWPVVMVPLLFRERGAGDRDSVPFDRTGRGLRLPGEELQQTRLSSAGLADDGEDDRERSRRPRSHGFPIDATLDLDVHPLIQNERLLGFADFGQGSIENARQFGPVLAHAECDLEGVCSIHLWSHLWWDERRLDFSTFHAGLLTEEYVRKAETTYSRAACQFLD